MTTMAESAKADIDNLGELSERFHQMSERASVIKGLRDLAIAFNLIADHMTASKILMERAYQIMDERLDYFHTDMGATE